MALLRLAAVALVDGEPDVAIGRDWLVYRDAADVVALVHSETFMLTTAAIVGVSLFESAEC